MGVVGAEKVQETVISPIGFAGLTSMASSVDAEIATPGKTDAGEQVPPVKSNDIDQSAVKHPTVHEIYQSPNQKPAGISTTAKWLLSIGLLLGIPFVAAVMNNQPQSSRPPQVSVNATAPASATEQVPPIGTKLSLGPAEIRYCLSEDIRLEAARLVVNAYSESRISRFNAMVNDYNSRCGSFRYRSGTLESAKADVERNRSALEAQGRSRFSRY
jgi:hypothetical protein